MTSFPTLPRANFRHHSDEWLVRLIAMLTGLMGLINLVSATFPALGDRMGLLRQLFPLAVRHGSHLAAALAGFALMLLAEALWRRKRAAWLLTMLILIVSSASHLLKGLDYEEASLAAVLALILSFNRSRFHAHSDMPSVWRGLMVLLAAILFTLLYSITGFYLLDKHFKVPYDFFAAVRQSLVMFTQFYDPGLEPLTQFGRFFGASIYTVAAVTLSYSLIMLVRPVLVRKPATADQRSHAMEIVQNHGRSSLARFTLFPDKSYFFSPGGTLFAFVPRGRVALVLGDPIGPAIDLPDALNAFKRHCVSNDWLPAFYQTLPDHLSLYKSIGLDTLMIGQEAIVDLSSFTLDGKAGKEFRTIKNKMERLGIHAEIHQPPLSADLLQNLRDVSNEWLTQMHGHEMRFSVGWFDDEYILNSPVMVITTPSGEITSFANLVPEYQLNEIALDLMRRRTQVENGSMDFLFISLLQWAKEQGYASFSLGLSALSGLNQESDNLSTERALRYIYENVSQFYNFKGLHAFKEKFHPTWQARYLVYPGFASLPLVGTALVRANLGDKLLEVNLFTHPAR